jgi:hypothetical protein
MYVPSESQQSQLQNAPRMEGFWLAITLFARSIARVDRHTAEPALGSGKIVGSIKGSSMSVENEGGHSAPHWFIPPGESDFYAWLALGFMLAALYGIVTAYAAFDRWAEHQSRGTPLAKTIPTLLAIALLYELFPLNHFHIFLPVTAVLIALAADWSKYRLHHAQGLHPWQSDTDPEASGNNNDQNKGEASNV